MMPRGVGLSFGAGLAVFEERDEYHASHDVSECRPEQKAAEFGRGDTLTREGARKHFDGSDHHVVKFREANQAPPTFVGH